MYIKCSDENSYDSAQAFSESMRARTVLAVNTKSSELLEIYAYDPEPVVRQAVAHNLNTPPEVLAALASDPIYSVRMTAVRNPYMPITALKDFILTADIFDGVDALHNDKLSSDVIETYYKKVNKIISDPAYNYEDHISWYDEYLELMSLNRNTPEYILAELANTGDEMCFAGLVHNPNTPTYLLETVALNSEADSILADAAEHPNATEDVLLELIHNRYCDTEVFYRILRRHDISAELLNAMLEACPLQWGCVISRIKNHPNFRKAGEDE